MALPLVINKLKALVLLVFGVIKRALCCFRRRRRSSCDSIPLTTIGVVLNRSLSLSDDRPGAELQSWNSWDDGPAVVLSDNHAPQKNAVQQQIEQYRQSTARQNSLSDEQENQPNFFEDMTPRITKQTKILLQNKGHDAPGWNETVSPRLLLAADPVLFTSPELETWEETPGWEDQTQEEWNPDAILWEKRRLERQTRLLMQQQKKQEREQMKLGRPLPLGARIS